MPLDTVERVREDESQLFKMIAVGTVRSTCVVLLLRTNLFALKRRKKTHIPRCFFISVPLV